MNIHQNNRVRLIRFLSKTANNQNGNKLLYNVKFVGLTMERNLLYKRIDERVNKMIQDGLIEEVKSLQKEFVACRVLNTAIGYKEINQYLNHFISKNEAIELIKKNSRHYAKRQYTWFNNKMDINWFDVNIDDFNQTIHNVEDFLNK